MRVVSAGIFIFVAGVGGCVLVSLFGPSMPVASVLFVVVMALAWAAAWWLFQERASAASQRAGEGSFEQRAAYGLVRTRLAFSAENLTYTISNPRRTTTRSIDYFQIPQESVEVRAINRAVTARFFAIAAASLAAFFFATHLDSQGELSRQIWHVALAIVLVAFPFILSSASVHVTAFHGPNFILEVIRDGNHDQILELLASNRRRVARARYGQVDFQRDSGEEIAKFRRLKEDGYISESEMEAGIGLVRAYVRDSARKQAGDQAGESPVN